jgi:hypothetical protein
LGLKEKSVESEFEVFGEVSIDEGIEKGFVYD